MVGKQVKQRAVRGLLQNVCRSRLLEGCEEVDSIKSPAGTRKTAKARRRSEGKIMGLSMLNRSTTSRSRKLLCCDRLIRSSRAIFETFKILLGRLLLFQQFKLCLKPLLSYFEQLCFLH